MEILQIETISKCVRLFTTAVNFSLTVSYYIAENAFRIND